MPIRRLLFCALTVILALAARSAAHAEDLRLAPASEAEEVVLARLTAGALLAWSEGDNEAILAAEDAGLLGWLNRERSLALTLPAERLLPPFAGEPWPCVPVASTLRLLTLRQIFPKVLNDLSVAVLLERALTLFAAQDEERFSPSLGIGETLRAELEADPAAAFRTRGLDFLVGAERAWLTGVQPGALSVATRDGGRWHVDWRLPLAMEEIGLRFTVGHAMGMAPTPGGAPADWPAETYLATLSQIVPGYPSAEELLRLAYPARPDPTAGCWEPFLDPTLMLCAKNDGWAPCQHCGGGLCAE